ncbi:MULTISPECIES: hypothetical protein [Luteimonas]|uniref:hypothetical protein n=1 Tax=Luteimonas TaxID=83614 RepID=UPI00117E5BFF|nr:MULTISPECIES: hypothetical protein [Luteimonas]
MLRHARVRRTYAQGHRNALWRPLGWSLIRYQVTAMLKFLGTTAGIIFLIGLVVVIGLLMLIF